MAETVTIDRIIRDCKRLEPRHAHLYSNGDARRLCVTQIYHAVQAEDGEIHRLADRDGKIGASYVRVSTEGQRSAEDDGRDENSPTQRDGFSETYQIRRSVEHWLRRGQAFAIYSDAGLSGGLPYNNPEMIRIINQKRADKYRACFGLVFLDPSMTRGVSAQDIAGMRTYLEEKCRRILAGVEHEGESEGLIIKPLKKSVHYRPGLTELIGDLSRIHTVTALDLSRLSRSYLLLEHVAHEFLQHKTRVHGIISPLDFLNSGRFEDNLIRSILSQMAEQRLTEVMLGAMQGSLQMLQSRRPHGSLPFWLERDRRGFARLIPEKADMALKIVNAFLALQEGMSTYEDGINTIRRMLDADGMPVPGRRVRTEPKWLRQTVLDVLTTPMLLGRQCLFGREWQVSDGIVDERTYGEIQRRIQARKQANRNANHAKNADYLATSLIRCSCGNNLSHRYSPRTKTSKKRGTVTQIAEQYWCDAFGRRKGQYHPTLHAPNVHAFLDNLMRYDAQVIIGALRQSAERRALQEQIDALAEEIQAERARLPIEEEEARDRALAKLDEEDAQDEEIVGAYIRKYLRPILAGIQAKEQQVQEIRARLAATLASEDIARLEDRAARWDALGNGEKNALLHMLFARFEIRGTPPDETLVPVMRTLDEIELPPVPLVTRRNGIGWERRLPEDLRAYFGAFRAV